MDYYNVIDISKGSLRSHGTQKYFCNWCNRSLFLRNKDEHEYICINCNIIFYPNNQLTKKANKFDLPGPETDSQGNVIGNNTIPIAMIDYPNKEPSSTLYKQQKLTATYEALRKQGFNWLNYEER